MPLIRPSLRSVGAAVALVGVLTGVVVAAGAATRTDAEVVAPPGGAPTAPPPPADPPPTTAAEPPATFTPATGGTGGTGATPTPTSATARPRRPAPAKPPVKTPASGQQAVAAFTAAVDRGDAAAAWRLLSPRSQAFWRTQARFTASFTELAEGGYGGWTGDRTRTARSAVINSSGEGEVLVVTLRGTTSRQGQRVPRAQAFPVRHVKGTFRLELWDLGGGGTVPEVTAPGPVVNATVRTSGKPTFQATARGSQLAWALDDRDATFTNVRGGVARYQPAQALTPGIHVLTVASEGPGWLTASAVIVQVR